MILWCLVSVVIKSGDGIPFYVDTAAKGKLIREIGDSYQVDFSEYAKTKNYVGDYTETIVEKDKCTPEKK